MAEFDRPTIAAARAGTAAAIDQGLRAYMLRVYNYMSLGLVVTGLVAFAVANTALINLFYTSDGVSMHLSILGWAALIAPIGLVFWLSMGINRMSVGTAQLVFWGYAALMGASLAPIFLVYTGASIAKVFFITAATFGATSLYGYTTKRDLTGMGNFAFMGLIGVVIASLVNFFLQSPALDYAISIIGVGVFTVLTAYDTQKIKENYHSSFGADVLAKGAIMGALNLYMDFINLFLMLLRLFGNRE